MQTEIEVKPLQLGCALHAVMDGKLAEAVSSPWNLRAFGYATQYKVTVTVERLRFVH